MRRGDIWTVSGGKDYAGKPRPVVIVQDDVFDATDSITVCAFTTDDTESASFPFARRTERAERITRRLPPDGGQDHHRREIESRRACRPPERRGYPASQSG